MTNHTLEQQVLNDIDEALHAVANFHEVVLQSNKTRDYITGVHHRSIRTLYTLTGALGLFNLALMSILLYKGIL